LPTKGHCRRANPVALVGPSGGHSTNICVVPSHEVVFFRPKHPMRVHSLFAGTASYQPNADHWLQPDGADNLRNVASLVCGVASVYRPDRSASPLNDSCSHREEQRPRKKKKPPPPTPSSSQPYPAPHHLPSNSEGCALQIHGGSTRSLQLRCCPRHPNKDKPRRADPSFQQRGDPRRLAAHWTLAYVHALSADARRDSMPHFEREQQTSKPTNLGSRPFQLVQSPFRN